MLRTNRVLEKKKKKCTIPSGNGTNRHTTPQHRGTEVPRFLLSFEERIYIYNIINNVGDIHQCAPTKREKTWL